MTNINEITLLIAVIALAMWPTVLFALHYMKKRRQRLEHIERLTKDELEEVSTKELVMGTLRKIGCQPEVNEDEQVCFKYQGDDFYIAACKENTIPLKSNNAAAAQTDSHEDMQSTANTNEAAARHGGTTG